MGLRESLCSRPTVWLHGFPRGAISGADLWSALIDLFFR